MNKSIYANRTTISICFILFVIGLTVFWIFGLQITGYIFAHIGAIGFLGFFGIGTAYFAHKKGYNEKLAFHLGFSVAILTGIIESVIFLLINENRNFVCGGAGSVIVALTVFVTYFLVKKRNDLQKNQSIQ